MSRNAEPDPLESSLPDQLPLPGLEEIANPTERIFRSICRLWYEKYAQSVHGRAPSRDVDELSLAAVLLARELGEHFTRSAGEIIHANLDLVERKNGSWMDRLPWNLALSARSF